jgi:hypothetical protein
VAAPAARRVWGVLGRCWGCTVGQGGGRFGHSSGAGALSLLSTKLLVPLFHEGYVLIPVLCDILSTKDILEFIAETLVESGPFGSIVPVEVRGKMSELSIIGNEVLISLAKLSNSLLSSVNMVRVTIRFLQGSHKIPKGFQVNMVILYQIEHLFKGRSIKSREGIAEFQLFIREFAGSIDETKMQHGDEGS